VLLVPNNGAELSLNGLVSYVFTVKINLLGSPEGVEFSGIFCPNKESGVLELGVLSNRPFTFYIN
jgi:hypothetical protein